MHENNFCNKIQIIQMRQFWVIFKHFCKSTEMYNYIEIQLKSNNENEVEIIVNSDPGFAVPLEPNLRCL